MAAFVGADLTTHTYLREHPFVVETRGEVQVVVPEVPLGPNSLIVTTDEPTSFLHWTDQQMFLSFQMLQKIAAIWSKSGNPDNEITDHYLVYGKQVLTNIEPCPFEWEVIPYYSSALLSKVYNFFQNTRVLAGMVFDDSPVAEESLQKAHEFYREQFQNTALFPEKIEGAAENDLFCNQYEVDKRLVLRGKFINVLFHNQLMGLTDRGIHLLLTPKLHKRSFTELSWDEYQEAIKITQLLIPHFFLKQDLHEATIVHKNGSEAGQTIPHWHMDLMFSMSEAQTMLAKLHVIKTIPEETSEMSGDELELIVREYIHQFIRDPGFHDFLPFG